MVSKFFPRLWREQVAAISPLFAIAILPLIVMAGVAFDYSRLMTMDSELQNAADQAALAAATQLNGQTGAMAEAEIAARNYFVNETRAAAGERPISSFSLVFYEADFDDDGNFDPSGGALDPNDPNNDSLAKVVEVAIAGRQARYALTPVMGRLFSDAVQAKATAMLDESTCNVAPMMFCAPSPGYGADSSYVGKTIALHLRDKNTLDSELPVDAPGNFGFLDIGYDPTKMPNDRLGLNTQSGVCVGRTPTSEPGNIQVESQYFNTRFERDDKKVKCEDNGDFCASENVRQGYVQVQSANTQAAPCATAPTNNGKWEILKDATYPLESCIANGTCTFADGPTSTQWDDYMSKVHGTTKFSDTGATTRYEMFKWEKTSAARMTPIKVKQTSKVQGQNTVYENYCAYPAPQDTDNVFVPGTGDKDRRVLTVAAADCTDLQGKGTVKVLRWLDVFLVDSAHTRGSYKEFVVEVMGPGTPAGGGTGFQYFGRGKAVLIQ